MRYETGALNLLRSKSLPSAVKEEIANLIISGQLVAGQKLTEFELAERLGVSRGPIREALLGLEEAGLIRMEKNRGVFVREISADEASELYEVRAGLEGFAGRLLAPRITAAQIAELRGMVAEMAASIERSGIDAYFPQNLHFHEIIVTFAGNAKLLMLYRRLINEMYLIRRHELLISGMRISVNEHSKIVDALESKSGDDAARVMELHVLGGRDRLIKILKAEAATKPPAETKGS